MGGSDDCHGLGAKVSGVVVGGIMLVMSWGAVCGSACHGLGTEVGGWLLSVEQLKKEKKRVTINQCDKIDGKGMIVIFLNN